jgi:hypothetical protein
MSKFIEFYEGKQTSTETTSNTSTKLFLLEKAIAELTGTVLVLKDELHKVKSQLNTIEIPSTPKVSDTIGLSPNVNVGQPITSYMSTIKTIMEVKQYEHVGKLFQLYLVDLVERPGVFHIHRDCALPPLEQGMKMIHQLEGMKIKSYRVQY